MVEFELVREQLPCLCKWAILKLNRKLVPSG